MQLERKCLMSPTKNESTRAIGQRHLPPEPSSITFCSTRLKNRVLTPAAHALTAGYEWTWRSTALTNTTIASLHPQETRLTRNRLRRMLDCPVVRSAISVGADCKHSVVMIRATPQLQLTAKRRSASMATETGCWAKASIRALRLLTAASRRKQRPMSFNSNTLSIRLPRLTQPLSLHDLPNTRPACTSIISVCFLTTARGSSCLLC